jgi:hypothetical protein
MYLDPKNFFSWQKELFYFSFISILLLMRSFFARRLLSLAAFSVFHSRVIPLRE